MDTAYQFSKIVSISLFLFYGLGCLFSQQMVVEFERFGLSRFRRLTGALEVLGALGLLVGYGIPPLDIVASAGLSLLMVLGVATRVRVRDPFVQMLPALVLLLINGFIFARAVA